MASDSRRRRLVPVLQKVKTRFPSRNGGGDEAKASGEPGDCPQDLLPVEDRIRNMEKTLLMLRWQASTKQQSQPHGLKQQLTTSALEPPARLAGYDPAALYDNPRLHSWRWLSDIRAKWLKDLLPIFVIEVSNNM